VNNNATSTKTASRRLQDPNSSLRGISLDNRAVNLIAIVLSLAAAYFMTIQSLKIELAAKAENSVVETLDKKLTGFEVILREGVVSKKEFYDFSLRLETRLDRIEQHLMTQAGETSGKR
jgi:hypothetical protein